MAKLLTRIWKATTGAFFETQLEALEAERQASFRAVIQVAAEKYLEPELKQYDEDLKRYTKARREDDRALRPSQSYPPTDPRGQVRLPEGFLKLMWQCLEAEGLIVPIKLEPED